MLDRLEGDIFSEMTREEHFDGRFIKVFRQRPKNLIEVLENTVQKYGEKEALVFNQKRLTYREFRDLVDAMACNLVEVYDLRPGDRVALLLGNNIEFCISFFAAIQAGAIAVPLNTRLAASELEFMLQHSGAAALITETKYWMNIADFAKKINDLHHIFLIDNDQEKGIIPFVKLQDTAAAKQKIRLDAGEEETVFIMYTSGTTGIPKGAKGSHLGVIHSAISYAKLFGTTSLDRTLLVVPLFHVTGLIGQLIHMVYVGGTAVLMEQFKTETMLSLMEREKITFSFAVPTIYVLMLLNPNLGGYDLSNYRIAAYGGAPMSAETVKQLSDRFPSLELHNAYGATETSSPTTILPDKDALSKISSIGLPVPPADIKVVDDRGNALPPNEVGELWIKGPMVIAGYWDNPAANLKEFTDGYWHSGDMARVDEEGYVYIMDRKKDMINRGGEKIFCVEVEDALCSFPKVLEAAVVGVPDEIFGEQVKAAVVPKPGVKLESKEVIDWVAQKLADFKVPHYVEILAELPRNPGGKVIKRLLK